ncbi:hypothetical protein Cpha266_0787 [Chlorobium phaeobacteroides DSM 266]|uniref:Uncharacterized protein n=1 Tax=Chlorobium phaeobacteroides (strain DSM 266 / SMG 266 / 2430) TaxID=290317 RepID=A1BEL2_CHLPD|nr:hypothetical protein Cpha266_0787 [Chlorobium phaeobacteroides DSM 266]
MRQVCFFSPSPTFYFNPGIRIFCDEINNNLSLILRQADILGIGEVTGCFNDNLHESNLRHCRTFCKKSCCQAGLIVKKDRLWRRGILTNPDQGAAAGKHRNCQKRGAYRGRK